MISLIHPSRGRAAKSVETIKKWSDRAGLKGLEILISIDQDDDWRKYQESHGVSFCGGACTRKGNTYYGLTEHNRSAVDAINKAAKVATGDILIVVSDDTDCPENWAVELLRHVEGKADWIAKCPDGIQSWLITMPVMDRTYYERFGYVYYPEYKHMFCDTELSCVADLTGRRINIPMEFRHLHYSVTKAPADEVTKRADSTWAQGEDLFLYRFQKNFDLVNPTGRITNESYLNWIKGKLK